MYSAPFTVMNPNVGNPRQSPPVLWNLQAIPFTIVRFTAQDGA
jgi:hypothetical protein